MGGRDSMYESKAQAGAAFVAGAGVLESHEALEDPGAVRLGDSGAVVFKDEEGMISVAGEREGHLVFGVSARVVDEVSDESGELSTVAMHANGFHLRHVDLDRVWAGGFVEHDVIEIDVAGPGWVALV